MASCADAIPPTTRGSVSTPPSTTPSLVLNEKELIRINVDKSIEKVKDAVLQDKVVTMKIVDRSQCTILDQKDYSVYPAMIDEFILKLCDTGRYRFTIGQDAITIGYRCPFLEVTNKEIVEGYAVGIVAREIATNLSSMSCSLTVMTFRDSEEILYSIPGEIRIQESLVGRLIVKLRELGFNRVDIQVNCLLVLPLPKIEPPQPVVPENIDQVATPEELEYDTFVFCAHAIVALSRTPTKENHITGVFDTKLKFDRRKRRVPPGLYLQMYDPVFTLMNNLGYKVMRLPDQNFIKIQKILYPMITVKSSKEVQKIVNNIRDKISCDTMNVKRFRIYQEQEKPMEGLLNINNLQFVCHNLLNNSIDYYIEESIDKDDENIKIVNLCCSL